MRQFGNSQSQGLFFRSFLLPPRKSYGARSQPATRYFPSFLPSQLGKQVVDTHGDGATGGSNRINTLSNELKYVSKYVLNHFENFNIYFLK